MLGGQTVVPILRSSSVSQAAVSGRSASTNSSAMPSAATGRPSSRNIHRQPESPEDPCICSSAPESGPPTIDDAGIADEEPGKHAGPGWAGPSSEEVGDPGKAQPRLMRRFGCWTTRWRDGLEK